MKKTLKKAILTLAAVVAVSVTMAVSAFAVKVAPTYTPATGDAKATLELKITDAEAGKQITVLVLKEGASDTEIVAEDITYINQDAANPDGTFTYTMTFDKELENGTYTVKVGGENVEESGIAVETFTVGGGGGDDPKPPVGEQVMIGDTDDNGAIKAKDALNALKRSVDDTLKFTSSGAVLEAGAEVPWQVADVDGNESVKAKDALNILKRSVDDTIEFARKSY